MTENIQQHQEETFQLPADGRMVLRTENLVKKYGKRTVVSHVSINVKQGEIVGLLGERSGKDDFVLHDDRTDRSQRRTYLSE